MIDWNTYFSSLRKYLDYYRQRDQMPAMRGYSTLSLPMPTSATVVGAGQVLMSEQELAGLVSLTQLITSIVIKDQEARRLTYENRHWNCVESCVGLLACSIPLVLKGYLYKFLAALSIDEAAAIHVWNCMLCEKLSVLLPDGKLAGVQQDLEDQECVLKAYDCSEGYLHLLRELFMHKTRPAAKQLEPHLQFIVKSVLCHYSQRSYSDVRQMWELVKLGFDCLYELLRLFYVTQAGVAARTSEVQLLAQLLNHTPLFKTLVQVLLDCQAPVLGEASSDSNVAQDADGAQLVAKKQEAAFSAIRLLYMALSNRSAISDAIRSTGSTLMIASLESLLFWPVVGKSSSQVPQQPTTCLSLLASFISDSDSSAGQTFYVLKILRVASAHRPSIQTRLVQSLYGQRQSLVHAAAALSSIQHSEMEVSQFDLVPLDVEKCRPSRLRGEVVRHLFETLIDAMESDGSNANIAYLLLGFNLRDIPNSQFTFTIGGGDEDHPSFTALHNVLEMALELATSDQPFASPHSALFEPALRLLLRLSAYQSASSTLMLRLMRSYDEMGLVYRLATSPLFLQSDGFADAQRRLQLDKDAEYGMMVATRSVQAVILELTALELAALLRQGHVESPKAFVIALLSTPSSSEPDVHDDSTAMSELGSSRCDAKALLWSLLDQSRLDIEEIAVPECEKFDAQKIDEMLRHCVLRTSCNVDQYDVEYVHLLLNTEISSIINAEIATIKEESEAILRYCAKRNAQNLLQAACVHVLSGWLSVVNVLALHAPVAFIEHDLHYTIMLDALFLLKNYCLSVETGVELSAMLSGCIFRVVRAMCSLLREMLPTPNEMKEALFPTLHLLLQCLVLPGYNKSVRFKMDLYGSILSVFESFNPPAQPTMPMEGALPQPPMPNLSRMTERERNKDSAWSRIFPAMTSEVVATISSDISYAPMSLKVVAASALSELVREDRYRGQSIAKELVNSGAIRCVLDAHERSMEGSKLKPQIQRIREDVDKLLS